MEDGVIAGLEALGLDAIREVGPGGHFFGAAHTLARYATAFYAPMVSDWRNFQQWDAAGRPLARRHWRGLSAAFGSVVGVVMVVDGALAV